MEKRFDGLHKRYVFFWRFTDSGDWVLGSTRALNFMLVARTGSVSPGV